MPLLQRCKICRLKKPCVKSYCRDCMPDEVKQAMRDKKREKAKQYKKTINANKRSSHVPTGEGDLFNILAKGRPHVCFITGTPIVGGIKPINCLHVLPKGQYPAWRLNPRNIVFAQAQCHVDEHSQPRSVLEGRPGKEGEGWRKYFAMQDEFKLEYKKEKE